jgi:phenylacetate-CoA ligase
LILNSKYTNLIRLLHNERRSIDELLHYQTIRLKQLVAHAYTTVPFYKKLYSSCGLHPNDVQSVEDISKLPIIDKKMIRQNLYDLISTKYINKKLIPVTTSGSSGMMLKFFIDNSFDQFRKAQFLRPYITNGKHFSDRTLVFSAPKTTAKKWFQHLGIMNETRIFYNTHSDEQIRAIQKIQPVVIQGCASVINLLALIILEQKTVIPNPKLIFTDSELLTENMRLNIEKAFGAKVIDIYGTYETDNIAYECRAQNGYHIAMDCVIMEFICEGAEAKPFEEGEIVVTVLNNFAMPFIRYNLSDIGSFSNIPCSCGRTLPLLVKIRGRSNDYMITREGKKLSFVNLESYWHSINKFVHEYQVIQEDIDNFTISIVPNNEYHDSCREIIKSQIYKYFPGVNIDINLVDAIERIGPGKFRTFKSKVE